MPQAVYCWGVYSAQAIEAKVQALVEGFKSGWGIWEQQTLLSTSFPMRSCTSLFQGDHSAAMSTFFLG